jgi:acyl-CoA thioesterase
MQESVNPFIDDNFAKHVGIELIEVAEGFAKAKLPIRDHHMNGTHLVHGGAIFTLAVWTMAVAANQGCQKLSVGLNADISYVKAATGGTLTAVAKQSADANKVSTWNVKITDDNDETIAVFKGLAYKKHR